MEFKKGNKLICKRKFIFYDVEYYFVGETVTIINIWDEKTFNSVILTCKIKNVYGTYEFAFKPEHLKNHFYTQKEYRSIKLKSIKKLQGE